MQQTMLATLEKSARTCSGPRLQVTGICWRLPWQSICLVEVLVDAEHRRYCTTGDERTTSMSPHLVASGYQKDYWEDDAEPPAGELIHANQPRE